MLDIDLAPYRFDFDLTFAVLFMHPDGSILGRYGGRTAENAESHLSLASLRTAMDAAREAFAKHVPQKRPPVAPRTIRDSASFQKRLAGGKVDCVHCHNINTAETLDRQALGLWPEDGLWVFPDPIQLGLTLDRDQQDLITEVVAGSIADAAGIRKSDRLQSVNGERVVTLGDFQWQLNQLPNQQGPVPLELLRDGQPLSASLQLTDQWKKADPWTYSWRAFKWDLMPAPGFGGPMLSDSQKQELGLEAGQSAFRVQYMVTWGERSRTGRNAAQAGLRQGDIVCSVGGKSDFRNIEHFHSWFRLTQTPGETVRMEVLREGRPKTLTLPVID